MIDSIASMVSGILASALLRTVSKPSIVAYRLLYGCHDTYFTVSLDVKSKTPLYFVTMHGSPVDIASISVKPNPSAAVGKTNPWLR